MSEPILQVSGVSLRFGGVSALDDVSLEVRDKEVYALIGPNGAGKTSLLNCINGFYRPQSGSICLQGQELVGMAPHRIAAAGIGRTFQNLELFRGISVLDNLLLGRHLHMRHGVFAGCLYVGWAAREETAHRRRVEEIIELLEIGRFRRHLVGSLAFGKQKLVEIGRALALDPKLLLLDEPAAGMNRDEKEDVARFILRIRHELGIGQVLIEHDVRFISDLSDRIAVLNLGRKVAEGNRHTVLADPAVAEAYLGTTSAARTTATGEGSR
jgi:branched-chain amino acid transport system ATP-binding protein